MAEVKKEDKKGLLGKIKEAAEDKEEQLLLLSTFVRLGILVWSAGILTLNYVEIPGYKQEQKIDPTFIASVFTGTLATFGVFRLQARRTTEEALVVELLVRRTWKHSLLRQVRLLLLRPLGLSKHL